MTQHCNTKNEAIRLFDYFFVCGLPENEPPSFFKQYEDSSSPGMVHIILAWKLILIYIYIWWMQKNFLFSRCILDL